MERVERLEDVRRIGGRRCHDVVGYALKIFGGVAGFRRSEGSVSGDVWMAIVE